MTYEHWALKIIHMEAVGDCVLIVLETQVPARLCFRWTYEPYWVHLDPQLRRGIAFTTHPRFCFTAYHDIWQEEEGDTLFHSYLICPWIICETRYFYFWGTILDNPVRSESPIFTFHNLAKKYNLLITEPWTWKETFAPTYTRLFIEPWGGVPPPEFWTFYEPWGATLTQNNPWTLMPIHDPPEYHLVDGQLTLISPTYESRGIRCYLPPPAPLLVTPGGDPLHFNTFASFTDGNPLLHSTRYFLFTENIADSFHIRLILAKGWQWVTFGENKGVVGMIGTMDYGQGATPLDLSALWIELRTMAALPNDPTGWTLTYIRLEMLNETEEETITFTNDWIGLYYPP